MTRQKKNSLIGNKPASNEAPVESAPVVLDTVEKFWPRLLESVGMVRSAHLKLAHPPAIIGPNSLAIRFPATYTSAYDSCASELGSEAIKSALKRITGREWMIRFEKTSEAVSTATTAEQPLAPSAGPTDRRKDLLKLPLFQKAVEALGAQIVRVEEGFNPTAVVEVLETPPAATDPISDTDEG